MGKTIAEKIFDSHTVDRISDNEFVLNCDLVLCNEITTPSGLPPESANMVHEGL